MNESGFTRKINKMVGQGVYTWKVSDRFTAGIPDCYYSGPAKDLWVEYKFIPTTKSTKQPAALSALQIKWLKDRMLEGRNVAVIVGVGTKHGLILTGGNMFEPLDLSSVIPCKEISDYIRSFCCAP